MGIKETADELLEKGKAVFDANADGKVEIQEIAGAVVEGAKGVAGAAAAAVDGVKQNLDIDEDGKVSLEEVQLVAEDLAGKAAGAVSGLASKITGKQ